VIGDLQQEEATMTRQRIGIILLFALVMLALAVVPVAAQGGEPGKLVVGGTYTLRSGQQLSGDLGVVGGQATVEQGATVNGDVLVAGGSLLVAGRINGDIAVFGGSVSLERTAVVTGDLVTFGGSVQRSPGAVVRGEVRDGGAVDIPGLPGTLLFPGVDRFSSTQEIGLQRSPGQWLVFMLVRAIRTGVMIMALAALALLVALLWPKGVKRLGQTALQQPVVVILVGLLSWVVGIGLFVFLVITICLIPLAILLALVLFVAVLLAWVVAGWLVGRSLLAAFKARNATVVSEAALGTLALATIYFLVGIIPCTEFIFGVLIASLGLGAIVLTRFGTRPYPFVPAAVESSDPGTELAVLHSDDAPQPPQIVEK
jgi:hypothetical protein